SQIRRNSNIPLLGIAGFSLFVGFGGFAAGAGGNDVPRWLRAIIPMIAALIGLLLRDAYKGSRPKPARRAALDVATVIVGVLISQAVLAALIAPAGLSPEWIISPTPRRAILTALALAAVFCLRMAADYRLPCAAGEISANDLAREFQQFERGVRWRKRREVVSAIGGLIVGVGYFWRADSLAPQITWALSTTMALFLIWYLASKTSVRPMPTEVGFASSLGFYRRELERQRRLLRSVAWLWLLPMLPAMTGELIGRGAAASKPLLTPTQFGGYLLICFLVGWLYEQGARKLQARSDSLATVAEAG
ncbi:MAG TPA: hypothetical protein VK479_09535, partial [Micropepsaceae bacterium]|nr:hypothetical protein [Micropepsaceae bacterium]